MEYRELGRSGIRVSVVGLGTWVMGGLQWSGADDDESIATIHVAIDRGVTLIDTAEVYGKGRSEEVVGRALQGRRDRVVLATKPAMWNAAPEKIRQAIEGSLKRLRTDVVDLYQVHWPHKTVPFEDTMAALEKLVQEGKVRAVGLSNFDVAQMRRCLGVRRIDSLQPPYSLFWRGIEAEIVPFCREEGIGILAYSPLAQGLLTGKFSKDTEIPKDDIRRHNVLFQGDTYQRCQDSLDGLREVAARYGRTPGQAAVNWLVGQPGMTSAILGARNRSQLEENLGATGWDLTNEDAAEIDRLGRAVTDRLPPHETLWGPRWY